MTSDALRGGAVLLAVVVGAATAGAAEPGYPFEGTWVRANRECVPNAPRVRTYTAKEVTSPSGRCSYRKVATGGGQFEIFEDCRRSEHPGNYTETIHMLGADLMQVRRQAARLKIARPLRYARCTIAAPGPAGAPRPAVAPVAHHPAPPAEAKPPQAEAKPPQADVKPPQGEVVPPQAKP